MIIANYEGKEQEHSYPKQYERDFNKINLEYNSVCIVTEVGKAPTCNYIFQFKYSRNTSQKLGASVRASVEGSFSGYGQGPSPIMITGGSGGFVAASGQVRSLV